MARISGVNIPTNKKIHIALTYIFGIGPKIALDICNKFMQERNELFLSLMNCMLIGTKI